MFIGASLGLASVSFVHNIVKQNLSPFALVIAMGLALSSALLCLCASTFFCEQGVPVFADIAAWLLLTSYLLTFILLGIAFYRLCEKKLGSDILAEQEEEL